MTPSGVVSVLHTFYGPDGSTPESSLLQAPDGALLGSTLVGGAAGAGVIFEVDPTLPLPVAALSVTPNPLTVGETGIGIVTLSSTAPSGGTVVELSTNNQGAAQVPRSVTVQSGRTTATFPVTTQFPISATASLLAFASVNGAGISVPLTVKPGTGSSADSLASLRLEPTKVRGGGTVVGTVTLGAPASSGGVNVALSSSRPRVAPVPSSVTVGEESTSASFTIATARVSSRKTAKITATLNGTSLTAQLTITR
jgi:hypothetical protein